MLWNNENKYQYKLRGHIFYLLLNRREHEYQASQKINNVKVVDTRLGICHRLEKQIKSRNVCLQVLQ